ncbi:acyl-CoA dehydrogenase family protein [Kitasatospora sp. NPDC093806]|uniref:acyl-CoA dehydrogenase family protein n=1 Tax=Kitasatospora sp. NPDC093806 TaxID=3155075 RepID=UPI00342BF1E7
MKVERHFADDTQRELFALVEEIADKELAPRADVEERSGRFPRETVELLGRAGLIGLPFPERWGGGDQPYTVYLQVLERLAYRWFAVAESVHLQVLASHGLARFGDDDQRDRWLPELLSGEVLGANALSEAEAGSDLEGIRTTAVREGDGYRISGTKSWVSHGGVAGLYNVYCRTGTAGLGSLTCLMVDAHTPGVLPQPPEHKMAVATLPTAQVVLDDVRVPAGMRLGRENRGMLVAASVFDHGRLGIAACAVGLAQAALDHATEYAKGRIQFGAPVITFQGVGFLLADMATQVAASRALLLEAARLRDAGRPFATQAAQAKLFATDTAMRVTTDAVQVLGGHGYVQDHPVERWMREAKLLQIIEGTNQIQRAAIARAL